MKSKLLLVPVLLCMGCASTPEKPSPLSQEEPELYQETFNELGYPTTRKLTRDETLVLERKVKIKKMEDALKPSEREQYYTYKADLPSDQEKYEFLSQPTMAARDRYVETKGLYYQNNTFSPPVKEAIQKKDIIIGMPKEAVMESWGEPQDVEVAGNEKNGNERWRYYEYVSTIDGYQKEERLVVFEKGKVVGWQRYQ